METKVDLSRKKKYFSLSNKVARLLWKIVWLFLFRTSATPFFAWRRMLLKIFGAKMGQRSLVYPSTWVSSPWNLVMNNHCVMAADVDCYSTAKVIIEDYVTISQYSYLCTATHDYEDKNFTLFAEPIVIKSQAWICADSMVGPGVTIGEGAVLGAKSSTFKDLEPWKVYAGTPAKYIKDRVIKRDRSNEKNILRSS